MLTNNEYSNDTPQNHKLSFSNSILYSIPALLYFVNNNLGVYIQLFMDPTSYKILSNLKIFTTAILYYIIIRKKLNLTKLISLVILFMFGVFYSIGNMTNMQEVSESTSLVNNTEKSSVELLNFKMRKIYITKAGLLFIAIYCFISGLAGVYNEFLFKKNFNDSIYKQKIYIYFYWCIFNFLPNFSRFQTNSRQLNDSSMISTFFKGFNIYTWVLIVTQVFNGFCISLVIKHSSNITRLFVISCSLIVTTSLVIFFSLQLNIYFDFGFAAILSALYLYTIN